MTDSYDILIKNASIVDGTGEKPFKGAVAIKDDRIAALGEVEGKAEKTVDAKGNIVSPGIIDVHNHGDLSILYYPEAEDQLLILPDDFETLRQAQASVVHFWSQVTAGMDFYRSLNQFRQYQPMAQPEVDRLVERTEWASLSKYEATHHQELVLLLGWGNPQAALDRQHWPASGCEAIHAVSAGAKPVGHRV